MAHTQATIDTGARPVLGGVGRVRAGKAVFAGTTLAGISAVGLDLDAGSYSTLLYVAVTQVVAVLGVVLTSLRPEHRMSWLIAAAGAWWALGNLAFAYAVEAVVNRPGSLPAGTAAAWLDNWAWAPGVVLFLGMTIVLMPDGHLLSRRWWPVPAAILAGTALTSIGVSFTLKFDLTGRKIANPLGWDGVPVAVIAVAGAGLTVAGLAGALAAFVVRFRRSHGDERQQLRWMVAAFSASVCLAVVGGFGWGVVPGAFILPAAALLVLLAGIAVAILKYRLYDLDVVVNRALVYGVLTAGVIGVYVLAVGLVGSYLSRRGDLVISLAVTGIVAVGFQPARERVQRGVSRLMYGHRDDPYLAAAELSRTLAGSPEIETVLPAAVETIGRTLAMHYVAIAVNDGRGTEVAAAYGTPGGEVTGVPLVHHDAAVGELLLSPRRGDRLRERDQRLVSDLAPQVAAAVHAVMLSRELRAARRRLVSLREEERRRIRRDLHDGLGPALAGLTLTLDAARNLTDSDARRADELLGAAAGQMRTLVGDVRSLIEGLRPPAIDELGLAEALRAMARQGAAASTAVEVDAPSSLPELPAALEVAAYWIAQEALTNVRRHAHARTCTVRLAVDADAITVGVEDDGVGIIGSSRGLGLGTMRERAAELGGTCRIGPGSAGGTLVCARLPRAPVRGGG